MDNSMMNEQDKKRETLIKTLKLLIGLNDKRSSRHKNVDSDTEDLLEWYDEAKTEMFAEFDKDFHYHSYTGTVYSQVPQFFSLLSECLLSHRWQECMEVLCVVSNHISETTPTGPATFRCAYEIFLQQNRDSSNQFNQFVTTLKKLSETNSDEVVLEYVLFLMTERRFEDAKLQIETLPKRRANQAARTTGEEVVSDILVKSYEGLLYYVDYLEAKHSRERLLEQAAGDPLRQGSVSSAAEAETQIMKSSANKAIGCFKRVEGKQGVWDIFITKYIELLEFLDLEETAKDVLEQNVEKNSEHPNALKLLYNFYCRHGYDSYVKMDILRRICLLVPSDEAVLQLHELLSNKGIEFRGERVRLLFDLVDYAVWANDPRPWSLLSRELRTLPQTLNPAVDHEDLREIWDSRATWWPDYHFDSSCLEEADTTDAILLQPGLYRDKAAVSKHLLGEDNCYALVIEKILLNL